LAKRLQRDLPGSYFQRWCWRDCDDWKDEEALGLESEGVIQYKMNAILDFLLNCFCLGVWILVFLALLAAFLFIIVLVFLFFW
jgi:hypothetical protein